MPETEFIYIFTGIVHPERSSIDIVGLPEINFENKEAKLTGKLNIKIVASQICARVSLPEKAVNLESLKNYVAEFTRFAVDVLGFSQACGYEVELIHVVEPYTGREFVFSSDIPEMRDIFKDQGLKCSDIFELRSGPYGNYIARCLSNLRESIRNPEDFGLFCYRTVEVLRKYFEDSRNESNEKKSWEILRDELGIDKDDLYKIKKYADPVRHGDTIFIAGPERAEVSKITWKIIFKYIHYARNGYKKILV